MSEARNFREALAVLRPGPFRRYMAGEAISATGTWMQLMAQSWVLTTLTDQAFMLGMVNFASGVPMLLLSMYGGTIADRYDKRTILQITQVVQIALALTMGLLVMRHAIAMWHVLVISALLGVSTSFEMPAGSSLVPELVEQDEIQSAIAIDRSTFHASRLIGPSLAGIVVAAYGAAFAFFVNAFSFVALMIALATLGPRPQGSEEEEAQRQTGMKEGLAYVRSDKPTLAMISLMAMTTVCVFPMVNILLPLYVKNELHLGPQGLGMLMAVSGVGSLLGAIGLLSVNRALRHTLMVASVAGIAIALGGIAVATSPWLVAPCMMLLSVCLSNLIGLANTTVQERAPAPLRGRVAAIAGLSFFGLMPIAGLALTSLSDGIGMRRALMIGAATFTVGAIGVLAGPARALMAQASVKQASAQG